MTHPPLINYRVNFNEPEDLDPDYWVYIPSLGHPTGAVDAYRTNSVIADTVQFRPRTWASTDTDCQASLGRIIDGPIIDRHDLARAECALQALLLHEHVEIQIPAIKVSGGPAGSSYLRLDNDQRSEAAFSAFQVAAPADFLFAIERVEVHDGLITSSTRPNSEFVGTSVNNVAIHYRNAMHIASELTASFSTDLNIAAYHSAPEFTRTMRGGAAGFIDALYGRVIAGWKEVVCNCPQVHFQMYLPPFLAIVLNRANHREDIINVLSDLREELKACREELATMNDFLQSTKSQADIIKYSERVNASFNAIVPESLLTDAERRRRRLVSVFNFAKPALQLYTIAADPLNLSRENFLQLYKSAQGAVKSNSRLVSQFVSSETFADLLRVESVRSLAETHFSESEKRLLFSPSKNAG